MCTVPEALESAGRSQEHWPCVHGTDQSFTASADWPAARTSARQSVAGSSAVKSILQILSQHSVAWLNMQKVSTRSWVGKKQNVKNCKTVCSSLGESGTGAKEAGTTGKGTVSRRFET
jgi:hypothetical protein